MTFLDLIAALGRSVICLLNSSFAAIDTDVLTTKQEVLEHNTQEDLYSNNFTVLETYKKILFSTQSKHSYLPTFYMSNIYCGKAPMVLHNLGRQKLRCQVRPMENTLCCLSLWNP